MQVVINLSASSADLLSEFGAGAKLYLYSASSEGGSYAAVGSGTTIVSGTERYEVYDAAGTPGTTWYKWRPGNSGGSAFGAYSAAWLPASLTAYATLDDLRKTLALGGDGDDSHDSLLEDYLSDVSSFLDSKAGRRFYRSPQVTGTTTVYFDVVECSPSLAVATGGMGTTDGQALDLVSVSNVYVRDSESSAYVELSQVADTDYFLQPGDGPGLAGVDWPYGDLVLSPAGAYAAFPTGYRAVKVTGVLGFPRVPRPVKRAVIAEVRERFRQGVSGGAAPQGVNQFGTPVYQMGNTDEFREVLRWPYARTAYVR